MYNVSEEYKESMKKPLRNKSYVKVSLGLINQEAQRSAQVENQEKYMGFSDFNGIFNKTSKFPVYAAYEKDFWPADGSMIFCPQNTDNRIKNGLVSLTSNYIGFSIRFSFKDSYDIKGLTIKFGPSFPTTLTIKPSSGITKTYEVSGDLFETEDNFTGVKWIELSSYSYSGYRWRIDYVQFGIGLEYGNDKIISAEWKSDLSAIDEDLPETSFSVTLDNTDQVLNVDNPNSAINYFEPGQTIVVSYGYELDNGTTEWMPIGTTYISDWSANDTDATIKSGDIFKTMNDTYNKGIYSEEGKSLWDVATDVFEDAGFKEGEYVLDDYLKTVIIHNPIPRVPHKEALQLIANAGKCILTYDRYGKPSIQSSFIPDYSITANDSAYFSDPSSVEDGIEKSKVAAYDLDYWVADGSFIFAPESGKTDSGYVSNEISDSVGTFQENPLITINMQASYKCYGIKINFQSNLPEEFVIRTYLSGNKNSENTISEGIVDNYFFENEFPEFDKVEIEFTKTKPYNRIRVNYISFGDETNYRISYDDMFSPPIGTQTDIVKKLEVNRTVYSASSTEEDLVSDTIDSYNGEHLFYYFDTPCYDYSIVNKKGGSASIDSFGSYYVELHYYNNIPGGTISFAIKGKKYNKSTSGVSLQLNSKGNDMTWDNPLISDLDHCKDVSEWIADYYKTSIEYNLDFRGEPAIDSGDTIFQESKYAERVKTIVEQSVTKFDKSISGTLKTRRKGNVERTESGLEKFR